MVEKIIEGITYSVPEFNSYGLRIINKDTFEIYAKYNIIYTIPGSCNKINTEIKIFNDNVLWEFKNYNPLCKDIKIYTNKDIDNNTILYISNYEYDYSFSPYVGYLNKDLCIYPHETLITGRILN